MYSKKIRQTGFMKHYLTLFSIVEGLEAKNTFEFGTGISTKVIIDALRITGGSHISCDTRNINKTGLDENYLKNNKDIWTYLQTDSQNIEFNDFNYYFDFVLHDGSHIPEIVRDDLLKILPHIKCYGIILVHDTGQSDLRNAVVEAVNSFKYAHFVELYFGCGLAVIEVHDRTKPIINPIWKKNE